MKNTLFVLLVENKSISVIVSVEVYHTAHMENLSIGVVSVGAIPSICQHGKRKVSCLVYCTDKQCKFVKVRLRCKFCLAMGISYTRSHYVRHGQLPPGTKEDTAYVTSFMCSRISPMRRIIRLRSPPQ